MSEWPDPRILDLFEIDVPILLAPMAGAGTPELAVAVSEAGGLGSLACSQMTAGQARAALDLIRQGTSRSVNVNFFCHQPPPPNEAQLLAWHALLAPFYLEHDLDPALPDFSSTRIPFNADFCSLVEDYVPEVVSFHFGLPEPTLLQRVRATGAKVISSATTVAEARWLMDRGCDAVIAMGLEAGGHRGNFLATDMARQIGTFALVPQIADAVDVPVIAAGGIADARGIHAALVLGAAAVQISTAYLFCPEANLSPLYLQALRTAADDATMITNVFTGRPARGIVNRLMRELGPISSAVPSFPLASAALASLRARAEGSGSNDFTNLWSGQAARLARELPAATLTRVLAREVLTKWRKVSS